jgi:hypothetical protein
MILGRALRPGSPPVCAAHGPWELPPFSTADRRALGRAGQCRGKVREPTTDPGSSHDWLPWLPTSEAREEYVRRPPCWVMTGRRALMARYADAPMVLTGPQAAAGLVQRLRGPRHRNLRRLRSPCRRSRPVGSVTDTSSMCDVCERRSLNRGAVRRRECRASRDCRDPLPLP